MTKGEIKMDFNKAKKYIYRNARPLDLARWQYLMENGTRENVLQVLEKYQNPDGGFGHAVEPDFWNPNSSPIQTWAATEILFEMGMEDQDHPMVQGILRYLMSGDSFDGTTWGNTISSNNAFPHAPWWEYEKKNKNNYNPTAALAGFMVYFAKPDSPEMELGVRLVQESIQYLQSIHSPVEMHVLACFVRLYHYLGKASGHQIIDIIALKSLLNRQVKECVAYDISRWETDYLCKPSMFLSSKQDEFYPEIKKIAEYELDFIDQTQLEDGTWGITWSWSGYSEAWKVAENWWKCELIIKNCNYMKHMK